MPVTNSQAALLQEPKVTFPNMGAPWCLWVKLAYREGSGSSNTVEQCDFLSDKSVAPSTTSHASCPAVAVVVLRLASLLRSVF